MMRTIFFSLFLLGSLSGSAQMGLRFFTEIPLEGNPDFFGNSYGVELLGYVPIGQNERFEARLGVALLNHTYIYKEVPDYAIVIDRNSIIAYEGVTSFEYYQEYIIAIGGNYNFIKKDHLKAFVGADFLTGMYGSKYHSEIDNVSNADIADSGFTLGYRLRAGIGYQAFDSIEFIAETHWGKRSHGGMDAWPVLDFGAAIIYYFN